MTCKSASEMCELVKTQSKLDYNDTHSISLLRVVITRVQSSFRDIRTYDIIKFRLLK